MVRGSRGARSAAVAVGLAAAGCLGVSAASAATVPMTVTFPGGTVTAGALPQTTATTPTTLSGSVDTATFAATFPKASVQFADAKATNVPLGAPYGSGDLTIRTTATGDFTGSLPLTFTSYDLSGPVSQTVTATTGGATYTCSFQGSSTLNLSGAIPNLATGAYAVGGSRLAPLLVTDDPLSLAFCTQLSLTGLLAGGSIVHSYAGSISIPGIVPPPDVAVVPSPTPTTPTTPTPATPEPEPPAEAKAPRLSLKLGSAKAVRRGGTATFTVTLRNSGTARARSLVVRLARPKHVVLRRTQVRFSSLPAGRTKTFTVRVRTTARTAARPKVGVSVTTADGQLLTRSRTLKVRR